jgi:HTH-type transcriptional regulator, sugar sensing transcriptional regulator
MNKETLTKIGLSKSESTIYLTLLKLDTSTVRDISKESGIHRTNIYDTLEKLKEKGLVTTVQTGKSLSYKTSDPKNLYNFLKERKETLDSIFPDLESLQSQNTQETEVIVFKGPEGMKSAYRDILRTKKTIHVYSATGQLRKYLPTFIEEFLRKQRLLKIKYYGIYTNKKYLPKGYKNVRIIPEELSSPVTTTIYGDNVLINIWHPTMIAILIKSKSIAETYLAHFNLIWKIAKPNKK